MSKRVKVLVGVGVVLVALAGVATYYFAPWTLFTNTTVNAAAPVDGKVLLRGSFVSQAHTATGTASIVELPSGDRVLRLENLSTDNGPDVKVWLSDRAVDPEKSTGFDQGVYVSLGDLQGNRGNQNYPIPKSTDIAKFRSVSLWCERFSVSFGAAPLQPA
ncbi:MAG: DM13 domain-containing protein [Acidimicrobiia bacterium]